MSEQPLFKHTTELSNSSALDVDVVKAGGELLSITENNLTTVQNSAQPLMAAFKAGEKAYNRYLLWFQHNDLIEAVKYYGRAIEIDNGFYHAKIQLTLALVEHQTLTLEQGIEQLTKISQVSLSKDEQARCLWGLGVLYKKGEQLPKAITALCQLLKLKPITFPKARFVLASLFVQLSQKATVSSGRVASLIAQALGQLCMGWATVIFDFSTFNHLVLALLSKTQTAVIMGVFWLLKQFGFKNIASGFVENAAVIMPNKSVFFEALAGDYFKTEQPEEAVVFYSKLVALTPANTMAKKRLAKSYLKLGENDKALQCLEDLAHSTQADGDVFYDLAHLYVSEKNYIKALYYFKEAAAEFPKNPYIFSNMAYVLFRLEDYAGAIEEYKNAIDYGTDPSWTATVAQTLATIYYQLLEDKDQALEYYMLANELAPDNVECMAILADLYFEENQLQDSLELYQRIKQLEPTNPECHNYIGYLLWQMDRNDEAIVAYEEALSIAPNNATALNNLGVIYLDEEFNPNKALTMFEKALEVKEDYTLAAFNLGRTKEWVGDRTGAAKAFTTAQQLNVENGEMADDEIQERINQLFDA